MLLVARIYSRERVSKGPVGDSDGSPTAMVKRIILVACSPSSWGYFIGGFVPCGLTLLWKRVVPPMRVSRGVRAGNFERCAYRFGNSEGTHKK